MNNWTYTNISKPNANVENLLELWETIGSTGLFRLEVDLQNGLSHTYFLRNTDIRILAMSLSPDHYELSIFDGIEEIDSNEFWDRIPKEYKKILAFHLEQLL